MACTDGNTLLKQCEEIRKEEKIKEKRERQAQNTKKKKKNDRKTVTWFHKCLEQSPILFFIFI